MNTAVQNPQDMSDLLTERGLQLILKPLPGSQPMSHKHDLNVMIMNRDELVRYAKPMTDLELALYSHLKEMVEDYTDKVSYEELEQQMNAASKNLEEAEEKIATLNEKIVELESKLVGELV